MNQKEIANTYALVGGTAAWKNAGYPMESSQSSARSVLSEPVTGQETVNANSLKK